MRLVVTADLHYEFERDRPNVNVVARRMCHEDADALALAGDTFALEPDILAKCLRRFRRFRGEKVLVPGNHDLWTPGGDAPDSFELYDAVIPTIARDAGFHDLDKGAKIVGDVAIVGTIGWYDYSFRDESLGVPLRFYEHKAGPGFAKAEPALRHLLDPDEALPQAAFDATSYWNDGRMVRWKLNDRLFNALTLERLEHQIEVVEPHVRAIVAVTHHIPFAQMVVRKGEPSWDFANAFMGSVGLGEVLLRHPRVTHAVFGHSHCRGRQRIAHVDALNVGSTYRHKRYDVIEV